MGVQRPLDVNLLPTMRSTFDNLQIASESLSFVIIHIPGSLIAHPSVSSSSSWINPHNVAKSEVLPQCNVHHFNSHGHERPAFMTDICFVATCSYLVVVCEIYIKNQLFCGWTKGSGFAKSFSISRVRRVHWSYFETRWIQTKNIFSKAT